VWPEAFWACCYYAATPKGAEFFRELLQKQCPARAEFAAMLLSHSGDFANVEPLLACAEQHADHPEVVEAAILTVFHLGATAFESVDETTQTRAGALETIRRIRRLLADQSQRGTGPDSYEQFFGQRLVGTIKLLPTSAKDQEWVLLEGIRQANAYLALSRDSAKAAEALVACFRHLEDKHYRLGVASFLLRSLQLHIGPIHSPGRRDIVRQNKAVREMLDWWEKNKGKRPVQWMLERLSLRGYATESPEDVKRTAAALVRALIEGRPAERYAATRILAYVLPDGDMIPAVYEDVVSESAPRDDPKDAPSAQEYCKAFVIYRAMRWAAWEYVLYSWDPAQCRYVRKRGRASNSGDEP